MSCNCQCAVNGKDPRYAQLDETIEQFKDQPGALIPVLQKAQEIFGYLPEEVQTYVAEGLNLPLSEVYGVVTFYSFFTTVPRGKYLISVCLGTACYVKGSGQILENLQKELGIKPGETTKDGLFTLQECRCLGACGLAPVLTVNEHVHGRLKPEDVTELVSFYREKEAQAS